MYRRWPWRCWALVTLPNWSWELTNVRHRLFGKAEHLGLRIFIDLMITFSLSLDMGKFFAERLEVTHSGEVQKLFCACRPPLLWLFVIHCLKISLSNHWQGFESRDLTLIILVVEIRGIYLLLYNLVRTSCSRLCMVGLLPLVIIWAFNLLLILFGEIRLRMNLANAIYELPECLIISAQESFLPKVTK